MILGGRAANAQVRSSIRERYHLDESLPTRYANWVTDALQGNFGTSIEYNQPVSTLITSRAPTTIVLTILTLLFVVPTGLLLGWLGATRGTSVNGALTAGTMVALATPTFFVAVGLVSLFSVRLGWFPAVGGGSGLVDNLHHLALPAFALGLGWIALIAQTTRVAMRKELTSEHVLTARARGLPPRVIVRRHVLRNAMVPITAVLALTLGGIVAGTVIIESAFGINGFGSLLVQSVEAKDFAVAQIVVLLIFIMYAVVNMIVDLAYGLLDPRIRDSRSRA